MNKQKFILAVLVLIVLSIYLFVSAPAPLPDGTAAAGRTIPIDVVFSIVAKENDVARALYTREIVGAGKDAGLAFGENWREAGVDAGPLPALFLREASGSLERNPVPLGLFLGSDYPIAVSNLFAGAQDERFAEIRENHQPQFFYAEDTQQYTAMFPDYASVQACVTCHNEHPQSPKTDWVLNDIMGATTWTYPKGEVTLDEALQIVAATRQGFADAYRAYLEKSAGFQNPPEIGENWPRDGYFLPSEAVFFAAFESQASGNSINLLLSAAALSEGVK